MPRKADPARDRAIADALSHGADPAQVASDMGVARSTVYRAAHRVENFAENGPAAVSVQQSMGQLGGVGAYGQYKLTSGMLYDEMARTGLRRFYGRVDDDYDRVMRTVLKRMQLFREMGDDPIVAATLNAIRLTLRKVGWRVDPVSDAPADVEAADFLDSAMHDMSQSWTDFIDQALGCVQYGFAVSEIVYKKRRGPDATPHSVYADGRIGWRKFTFLAPESLAPGNEWAFDEVGGIQAVNQQPPPDYQFITVPIDKAVLFRTTTEKNNPEGRSILRAMYPAWYYKKNLEEIEAISAERLGAGFPVFYAGSDVAKGGTTGDDLDVLRGMVRNVRVDEQMGLVLPWAKMGSGAREGEGVLFELISPPSKGNVDFNQTITRHEQRMAMVGLGQFIMLGMSKIGTQALASEDIDFFTLAVSAWADSLEDTIHRYATTRLVQLNYFPGITALPRITHDTVGRMSLAQFADAVNKLVGAQVLTPGPELEDYIRKFAELPEKPATVEETPDAAPQTSDEGDTATPTAGNVKGALNETQDDTPDTPAQESQMPVKPEEGQEIMAELRAAVKALFSAPAAAPGITIQSATLAVPDKFAANFTQPAPIVNVDNSGLTAALDKFADGMAAMAQPPQFVINVPEQPAPIVNVAAPIVNVPPAQVTVTPAAPIIQVDAQLSMAGVEEETVVNRDKATGQIVNTVKRYRKVK